MRRAGSLLLWQCILVLFARNMAFLAINALSVSPASVERAYALVKHSSAIR